MFWQRRLPHWVPEDSIVFVTWRLAGTLPQVPGEVLRRDPHPGRSFRVQDRRLDSTPQGPRWLQEARVATVVAEALAYGEKTRGAYSLLAWVIMPNHVHLVLRPQGRLSAILRWLKTATATRANRLLGKTGEAFWQREYFDRWVRSEKELASVVAYVEANPVAAGLVSSAEDWPWSSARKTPAARPPALPETAPDFGEM
jgi:REP element-mobilizing transposase RayT